MNQQQRYQLLEPRGNHASPNLGEGAYGVVYKALDKSTEKYVALKKIRMETEFDGISSSTLREITLLLQLNHENVVKLENVVMDKERMSLIFELVDTDLKKYMDQQSAPLSTEKIRSFTSQLLSGLAYCHSMGVMHRDLKPHNILVSLGGKLKIADFGLARAFTPFHRPLTTEVITRWYRSPEILLGYSKYNSSVDLWSIGCIMAEMSNNQALLMGDSDIDQLYKIFRLNGTPTNSDWVEVENLPYYRNNFPKWPPTKLSLAVPNLPEEAVDLLEKFFNYDPLRRISAKAALNHPFIKVVPLIAVNPVTPVEALRNKELLQSSAEEESSLGINRVTPDTGPVSDSLFDQNLPVEDLRPLISDDATDTVPNKPEPDIEKSGPKKRKSRKDTPTTLQIEEAVEDTKEPKRLRSSARISSKSIGK